MQNVSWARRSGGSHTDAPFRPGLYTYLGRIFDLFPLGLPQTC